MMKKIFRLYFILTSVILCSMFLFCGIVGINDETSYVITGERNSVVKAQSINGEQMLTFEKTSGKTDMIVKFDKEKLKSFVSVAKYCVIPPTGCVFSCVEKFF